MARKNSRLNKMEGILKFNLSNESESELFKLAVHFSDFYFAIKEFDKHLRYEAKYKDNEIAQELRESLYTFLKEAGVSLDMLS